MLATINFGFLQGHDQRLATLGAQAERYFRDDPSTAIVKLRQFSELRRRQFHYLGRHGLLEIDQDVATAFLKAQPFDFGFPLRPYQRDAIVAVEDALAKEQRGC
jgi:hypothetical protein